MEQIFDFLFSQYAGYTTMDIWLEAIAAVFGIVSVFFAMRANILVYPTGLVSTCIYIYVCLIAGLYGDMGINFYYSVMSIYGWYQWTHPVEDKTTLPITSHTPKERILSLSLVVVFYGVLLYVLINHTDSTVPYIDAFTTSIFFVAMWEMARKKLENWVYWIIGDIVSIPLYYYKGLTLTSIQFIVFLGLAISGYLAWRKEIRNRPLEAIAPVS